VPYLVAGLGGLQYNIDGTGHDDEDYLVNWGGGFKYAVASDVDLRLDLRHTIDFRTDNEGSDQDDNISNNLAAMFGLNIQFGGVSPVPVSSTVTVALLPAAAATPVPVSPVAADEPAATIFPAVAPVINTEATVGDDRDGVPEPADRCPGTVPGVRVDSTGCPADTDRDGVADYLDACIDTLSGARIDGHGCPESGPGGTALPLTIQFGVGKSEVNPFHYRELDRAAAFIRQHPHTQVLVEVPEDAPGLAQARAESLRRVLIARYGIPAGQITAIGDSLSSRGVVVSVVP